MPRILKVLYRELDMIENEETKLTEILDLEERIPKRKEIEKKRKRILDEIQQTIRIGVRNGKV